MTNVDLPQELYKLIVDHISYSKDTLTACAISHRCFTELCHRHLFNRISLHIPNGRTGLSEDKKEKKCYWEKRCRTLGEIFLHNPRIMYHVRRFNIALDCGKLFGDFPDMVIARAVADMLRTLGELENPKLEEITLHCPLTAPYWCDIPSTIQCAVFGIRRCSSVAELRLENVQLSPLSLIETWTGLKALILDRSSFLEGLFRDDENGDSQSTRFDSRNTSELEEPIPSGPNLLQLQVRSENAAFDRLYGRGYLNTALRGLQHLSLVVLNGTHKHLVPRLVDGVSSTLTRLELTLQSDTLYFHDWAIELHKFPQLQNLSLSINLKSPCLNLSVNQNAQSLVSSNSPHPMRTFTFVLLFTIPFQREPDVAAVMSRCEDLADQFRRLDQPFSSITFPQLTDACVTLGFTIVKNSKCERTPKGLDGLPGDFVQNLLPNLSALPCFTITTRFRYMTSRFHKTA